MYWGGLSDRLGRKPVLIMGCFGTIASLLVVGFAFNFWIALLGRLLGGALNGNIGVIQTMVAEVVKNPKHEPKAYAIMPFVWSIGTIVGPSIGGFFAEPSKNFPAYFSSTGIFGKFPYLLPNLICVGLMLISIVAGYLCLEETHPDMQPWSTEQDLAETHAQTPFLATQANTTTPAANLTHESYGTFNEVSEEPEDELWRVTSKGKSRPASIASDTSEKVFTPRVIMLNVALGIFTYHSMTYDHLLPIFFQDEKVPASEHLELFALANERGSLAGGLGLSTQDVGVIMSVNGLIALAVQALVFPLAASRLGIWRTFILVTLGHPIAYFIVPFIALLPSNLVYPGIYTCLTIRNLFSILAYPVLLILIKEAAPNNSCLGKINGLAASTGAACRTIASPVAGLLYGIGISLNFTALAWWGSAVVAIIGAIQAFFVNRRSAGAHHNVHSAAHNFLPAGHEHGNEEEGARKPHVVRIQVEDPDMDSGYYTLDERELYASAGAQRERVDEGAGDTERTPLRVREL